MKQIRMKLLCSIILICALADICRATEGPYFVTYTSQMEEPDNLEIENKSVVGEPSSGNRFIGSSLALEYGLTGWWTTEVYFDGQATADESSLFTGYRWENRFRVTRRDHWINPVLYVEFENLNGANKSLLEVVGHDGESDLAFPNRETVHERKREAELKLLLDINVRGWNISENMIVEKNFAHQPWEFGYAAGISRPLSLAASSRVCGICRENFNLGVEAYGGLGNHKSFGSASTSQYLAPLIAWAISNGITAKISPGFGLTASSAPFLFRFGISYELPQVARTLRTR
jgi:hypothetical protein